MRKRIGPYQVIRRIGRGGSATVYLITHPRTKEEIAAKLFHADAPEEQMQAAFRREVEIVQHLRHPNIIKIFEKGFDEEDVPYFTMNYASGGNLRTKHKQGETVPLSVVQTYVRQIAAALQYAHDQKVMHCDVKPENILITQTGNLLLSDFGIARIAGTTQQQTTKDPGGTIAYKAPEQFKGKPLLPFSDQYALAIMLYEWLCGVPPFRGSSEHLLNQHLFEPPPSLRAKNPAISEQIEDIIMRALKKEPTERFPSIQDFAQAFEEATKVLKPWGIIANAPGSLADRPMQPLIKRIATAEEATAALQQAQHYWEGGQFNEAIRLCEQILRSGFDHPETRYSLGWLYQQEQRWDEAIQQYRLLLEDLDYALSSYYALGQCYQAQGNLRAATAHFDEAIDRVDLDALTVEEADQLIQLCREGAEAYLLLGEKEQAITIYTALLDWLRTRGWADKVTKVEVLLQKAQDAPDTRYKTSPANRPLAIDETAQPSPTPFQDALLPIEETASPYPSPFQAAPLPSDTTASTSELPEWLTGILNPDEKETSTSSSTQPTRLIDENTIPAWLRNKSEQEGSESNTSSSLTSDLLDAGTFPSWMKSKPEQVEKTKPIPSPAYSGPAPTPAVPPTNFRDISQEQAPVKRAYLRVEEGKEPGRSYPLRKTPITIGRSRESDIFLEDIPVSRVHASVLDQGNNTYAIRDEGSTNGTKLNGQTLIKHHLYPLKREDRIEIGTHVFVFSSMD